MTQAKIYMETSEGVHLGSAWDDRTLCGDAMEGDPDHGIEEVRNTKARVVTCKACIDIIMLCRGVKTAP